MLVAYLTVFVFSTSRAIAPLLQAPFFLLFSLAHVGFFCVLILHLIAQKNHEYTETGKGVNEISLPPPLFCFHAHICNRLHLYKLFFFPPNICYVIGQLKLKTPMEKDVLRLQGHTPPTPLPPHTFPHNLLEEYRICTSVRISLLLPSSPRALLSLIFL